MRTHDSYMELQSMGHKDRQIFEFDRVVDAYKKNRYGFRSKSHDWMSNSMNNIIKFIVIESVEVRTILDMGTGSGDVVFNLIRAFPFNVVGIDLSPKMVEHCRGILSQEKNLIGTAVFVEGDFFNWRCDKVDGVIFKLALHHVEDIDRAIIKSSELLRREGFIMIGDILSPEDDETYKLLVDFHRIREPANYEYRKLSEIKGKLSEYGFTEQYIFIQRVEMNLNKWLENFYNPKEVLDLILNASQHVKGILNFEKRNGHCFISFDTFVLAAVIRQQSERSKDGNHRK